MATNWSTPAVQKSFTARFYSIRRYTYNGVDYEVVTQDTTGTRLYYSVTARSGWRDGHRLRTTKINGYPPIYSYSSSRSFLNFVPVNMTYTQKGSVKNVYTHTGDYLHAFVNNSSNSTENAAIRSSLRNQVITNLNNKVRNQFYSAPEVIYEGRKTVDMVVGAIKTIASSAMDIRKGKFQKAARTLGLQNAPKGANAKRTFSDNWLEYRYGWTPLLLTVKGEIDRIVDHGRYKPIIQRVASQLQKASGGITYFTCAQPALPTTGVSVLGKESRSYENGVKGIYYFKITNPNLTSMTEVGLTNPALVIWEAVPFSFVADWFVNVSDVLSQYDAFVGKQFLNGCITEHSSGASYYEVIPGIQTTFAITGVSGISSARGHWTKRDVLSSPPTVSLRFEPSLNLVRVLDGISLLKQIFR